MELPIHYRRGMPLETLVENRTTYTFEVSEMNIFETHQHAQNVWLHFDQPVLASMIKGKKIMHLKDKADFPFLPGESLMLPADRWMHIDFPEADLQNPTQCLALTIAPEKIKEVRQWMEEHLPKVDQGNWTLHHEDFHFSDDPSVYKILHRLIYLCVEDHPSKDFFVDMTLQELLLRLFQAESRNHLLGHSQQLKGHHRLAFVIDFIRHHLSEKLTIKQLSGLACMSESHFSRVFKQEMGISALDFVKSERLKLAASLLLASQHSVQQVCLACGFNTLSYFHRVFKQKYGESPNSFRAKVKPYA
ncbi:MAG: AraC family transcriptional regulator [Bacteroidota bacterium]